MPKTSQFERRANTAAQQESWLAAKNSRFGLCWQDEYTSERGRKGVKTGRPEPLNRSLFQPQIVRPNAA